MLLPMRTLLFASVLALGTLTVGCSKSEKSGGDEIDHSIPEISIDDVQAGLAAKTLTVLDCNSDKTRKRVGVIEGAVLVEDEETFEANILPSDKTAKLVFYCGGPG